jgi:hypothetical protein
MKRFVTLCAAAAVGAGLLMTSLALAADSQYDLPPDTQSTLANDGQPTYLRGSMTAYFADADKKAGVAKKDEKPAKEGKAEAPASCGCEAPSCGCEAPSCGNETPSCGSETGCCSTCGSCDDCCDLGLDKYWPFCCCCKAGDPCTLQKWLTPCCNDVTYGGFIDVGTYTQNTGLSAHDGDQLDIHDYPGRFQLSQAYFDVEKKAKTDSCCCDWGYRWDVVYGTEAFAAQAFGNQNNGWDKDWDHGAYAWAMPQAYVELGWNDWDIKMGHFYTPMGYEVFPANGNFFYSRSLAWFNSEPITHTGAVGTYAANKCTTYTVGWTTGWDTAFDAFDGGNDFMGGISQKLNDNVTLTYLFMVGNFGFRSDGEFGFEHCLVLDAKLSKKWEYVLTNDLVETDGSFGGNGAADNGEDYGVTNYFFYTINDCWKMGTRLEWWKSNQVTGQDTSFYEVTYGFNYKYNANWIVRPEVRYDWTPSNRTVADTQDTNSYDKVIFGIDAICSY